MRLLSRPRTPGVPGDPLPPAAIAACLGLAVSALASFSGCSATGPFPSGEAPPVARLSIQLPAGAPLAVETGRPAIAVSRKGDRIVYVARRGSGTQLYIRPIEKFEAIPLPGTDGATEPFLSPHGDLVGFFSGGRLRRISLGSLEVETICEVRGATAGASWGPDDTVVFAADGDLWRVPSAGGTPERIGLTAGGTRSATGGTAAALWPEITPGGGAVVFTLRPAAPGGRPAVAAFDLAGGHLRTLAESASFGRITPTGHLLYVREGTLVAAPFDPGTLKPGGRAVPVLEGVLDDDRTAAAQYALSATGILVYVPSEASTTERSLLWVDRRGGTRPVLGARRAYELPRLSPDGKRLAISIAEGDTLAIWIHAVGSETLHRLPLEWSGGLPLFTPDGRSIVYISPRAGGWNLLMRPADPSAAGRVDPELLMSGEHPISPTAMSPDGRVVILTEVHPETRGDIVVLPLDGERRPRPFLRTPADDWGAVLSPDGRFLAHTSNASGRNEVYVTPFGSTEGAAGAIRVSRDGGYGPIWSRDGGEIFFRDGDAVLASRLTLRPVLTAGTPAILFRGAYEGASAGWPNYDLAPDGRFVMVRRKEEPAGALRLDVVLGFQEELRRAVARGQE